MFKHVYFGEFMLYDLHKTTPHKAEWVEPSHV